MRVAFFLLVILFFAPMVQAQSITESLQECPGTFTGSLQPEQIHLQVTDEPSEMVVMWATEQRGDAVVEWGTTSLSNSNTGESYCYNHDRAFHMAKMTNLELGTEVTYRVGDGNTWSAEYKFTPINPDAEHFEWISIADHGLSSEGVDVSEAIIEDTEAQLVTISGDISYADGEQSVWDEWFLTQQESMVSIPWLTVVGNHENEPAIGFVPYEHRFDSDEVIETETFWYSREFPGVHMILMSTEHDYSPGSIQYSWLEQDLSSVNRDNTPFVIVYGHRPMYSSNSYHGSEVELRDALEELYVSQGVDLVIAGHDHFYERTWPVSAGTVIDTGKDNVFSSGKAPIHLVIGIAGRSAYEELDEPQPEWSAYRENNTYGWTRLVYDGNENELSFTHYRIDGSIGDQFTIQPSTASVESEESSALGLTGIDSLFAIIALLGAGLCKKQGEQ